MIYKSFLLKLTLEKQNGYYFPHTDPHSNEKYFLDSIKRLIDFHSGPAKKLLLFGEHKHRGSTTRSAVIY